MGGTDFEILAGGIAKDSTVICRLVAFSLSSKRSQLEHNLASTQSQMDNNEC